MRRDRWQTRSCGRDFVEAPPRWKLARSYRRRQFVNWAASRHCRPPRAVAAADRQSAAAFIFRAVSYTWITAARRHPAAVPVCISRSLSLSVCLCIIELHHSVLPPATEPQAAAFGAVPTTVHVLSKSTTRVARCVYRLSSRRPVNAYTAICRLETATSAV